MTFPSDEFSRQRPELTKSELYDRATALMVDMALFADRLSEASRHALATTNGLQAVADRGNGWPLADAHDVKRAMRSRIEELVQERKFPTDGVYKYGEDFWGSLKYYDHHDLAGIYDSANPRPAFVADVRGWTNAMARTGWPLITRINAAFPECIVLEVFDETPAVKTALQQRVDASVQGEDYGDEARRPSFAWIDPRVCVFGDATLIEECTK